MAIAVNGGHVSRALDFYDKENKYFIIGGSEPWKDEPSPELPKVEDFKLRDIIGLKKVDTNRTFLVVPDNSLPDDDPSVIKYREQKWRKVNRLIKTTISTLVSNGSNIITVDSVAGINVGNKLRIHNLYEGIVTQVEGNTITLDTVAPNNIEVGSTVEGGAHVEVAKYVYVECYLEYNRFPLATYRQIGLCTDVIPSDPTNTDILRSAKFNSETNIDEYESLGVLEILDNRAPIPRDINMRELISMIVEF